MPLHARAMYGWLLSAMDFETARQTRNWCYRSSVRFKRGCNRESQRETPTEIQSQIQATPQLHSV